MPAQTIFDARFKQARWSDPTRIINRNEFPVYLNQDRQIAFRRLGREDRLSSNQTDLSRIAETVRGLNVVEELVALQWNRESCLNLLKGLRRINRKIQKHNEKLERKIQESQFLQALSYLPFFQRFVRFWYSIEQIDRPIEQMQRLFTSRQRRTGNAGTHDLRGCQLNPIELSSYARVFPQIQSLVIDRNIKDEEFDELISPFPRLRNIGYLSRGTQEYRHLTDHSLHQLAERCTGLFGLCLPGSWITDTGLKAIARRCKQLKGVKVSGCEQVTWKGVHALISECKELKQITLSSRLLLNAPEGVFQKWVEVKGENRKATPKKQKGWFEVISDVVLGDEKKPPPPGEKKKKVVTFPMKFLFEKGAVTIDLDQLQDSDYRQEARQRMQTVYNRSSEQPRAENLFAWEEKKEEKKKNEKIEKK